MADETESDFSGLDSDSVDNLSTTAHSDSGEIVDIVSPQRAAVSPEPFSSSDGESADENLPRDPEDLPPDWQTEHFRDFHVPPFRGQQPGPRLPDDFNVETAKPIDYFQLFFSDELLNSIVQHTNSYAVWAIQQKRLVRPQYKDPHWRTSGEDNVTLEELKAFLGLLLIFGLNPVRQYQNAFSPCPFLGNQGVRNTMSLKRFEKLCQYFHISDRVSEPHKGTSNYDPLYKVRHVMETLLELFPKFNAFAEEQCIDESMIRCKARLPYIMFNSSKPVRKGIQVFVRTDAKSGYCQQFEFYLGAKLSKPSGKGLYFDIIDRLTKSLHNTNARVFFDNAYTSVKTAIHLQRHGVLSTGTLRGNRLYNPPPFKAKKKIKLKRGEHKVYQDRNNAQLTAVMWQDVKLVFFLSTLCKPHITTTSLRRFGYTTIEVSTPHAAHEYHRFYKGTDFFDQLCERYDFSRRHYRSWMYLFNFMFNATVVNCYILFKKVSTAERKKTYAQFDFCLQLALGLINHFSSRVRSSPPEPLYIGPNAPTYVKNHENTHMRYPRVRTCIGHRKFEGKSKKTAFGCTACNISLCKSCHPKWHCN